MADKCSVKTGWGYFELYSFTKETKSVEHTHFSAYITAACALRVNQSISVPYKFILWCVTNSAASEAHAGQLLSRSLYCVTVLNKCV